MMALPNLQAWTNGFLKFPELQNKPTGNRNPQWNTASPSALPCIQSQTTVCIDQDSSRTVRSGESTTFVANGRPKICVAAEQKLILSLKTTFRIEIFKNLSLHMFKFAGLTSSNPTSVMVPGQKQTIASLSSHYIHGCVVLRSRGFSQRLRHFPSTITVHQAFARKAWVSARNSASVSRCTLTSPMDMLGEHWVAERNILQDICIDAVHMHKNMELVWTRLESNETITSSCATGTHANVTEIRDDQILSKMIKAHVICKSFNFGPSFYATA